MPDLLDRLKAALADRYAIEEEFGAGGLATVYLAEDLKHDRKVGVESLATRTQSYLACRKSTEYWMGCPACRS